MIITEMQHLNDSPQRKNSDAWERCFLLSPKIRNSRFLFEYEFLCYTFLAERKQTLLSGKRQTPWSPTEGRSDRSLSLQYDNHINPFLKGLPLDSERRFQDLILKCMTLCLEELYYSCDLIAWVTVHKNTGKEGCLSEINTTQWTSRNPRHL